MRLTRFLSLIAISTALWAQPAVIVAHDATSAVQAGDVLQVEVRGPAGGVASFQIEGINRVWPLHEERDGLYTADYTVRRNDNLNNKLLTATVKTGGGQLYRGEAPNRIGTPVPVVTLPPSTGAAGELQVRSIDVQPRDWLKAGGVASFEVVGTPGSRATLTAPGYFTNLPLSERVPGRYSATWTVPSGRGVLPGQPALLARLTRNDQSAIRLSGEQLRVDTVAPVVLACVPGNDENLALGQTELQVAYDEGNGSDLDRTRCTFYVDNQAQSERARYGDGLVTLRLPTALAPGRHRWGLTLVDRAGNVAQSVTNTFTVVGPTANLEVRHSATTAPQPGEVVTVTFTGPTGGRASFSIGTVATDQPMTETRQGVYTGEYVVRRTDRLAGLPVVVNFADGAGRRQQVRSDQAIGQVDNGRAPGTSGALAAPVITSPTANSTVEEQTALRGTAPAGARVEIVVEGTARVAGFLEMKVDPIKLAAVVNGEGVWATAPVRFERPALAGRTTYTITAVTVSGDRRSEPTVIKVER